MVLGGGSCGPRYHCVFSVAVIKEHTDQSNLGKKGFIWLILLGRNPSLREEESQVRNSRQDLEAETMEE